MQATKWLDSEVIAALAPIRSGSSPLLSPEARHFLDRLERLLELQSELASAPRGLAAERLLKRATYSSYLDCIALGAAEPARTLLRRRQTVTG